MKKNPELPHEVVFNILAGLPLRSLLMFKTVCSLWRSTIESPRFVRLQASYCSRHEPEDKVLMQDSASFYIADVNTLCVRKIMPGFELSTPRAVRLHVYSSNGVLILVEDKQDARMVLWNPATGKYRDIINPPGYGYGCPCFYGFWCDDSCNEFRILSIRSYNQVLVFDSKSKSWKTVDTLPHNLRIKTYQLDSKAFIHGGFHVAALDTDERYRILSLSPEGKVIRDFGPPSDWNKQRAGSFTLATKVWEGRLCLQALAWFWDFSSSSSCFYEYWNMEEYGKSESWKRVESFQNPGYGLFSLQLWRKYSDNTNYIRVKDGDSVEMKPLISSSSKSMPYMGTYTYTPTLLSP